jgi:TonB family protein
MNDRVLYFCVLASFLIHAVMIAAASLIIRAVLATSPVYLPIELITLPRVADVQSQEVITSPAPSPLEPKAAKVTTPKLLSNPGIIERLALAPTGNSKQKIEQPEKPVEPQLASLPPEPGSVKGGWNVGERPGEAEGAAPGAGNLFGKGDVGVVDGSGFSAGSGGTGNAGLGGGTKGDGTGGGSGFGNALSSLARPLGGYQTKPSYPESARRAGAQGTTLLKLHILENGKVGEVQIEKSAGHPDLDTAAVNAVRKWLFEPARMGQQRVAVWVLLPVKFELH